MKIETHKELLAYLAKHKDAKVTIHHGYYMVKVKDAKK